MTVESARPERRQSPPGLVPTHEQGQAGGRGHARGRRPVALAWGSGQLLAGSSCSWWPRDRSWARRPGTPLQAPGGLGDGVEFLPRKEGWCGGKVGRYNTNIQVMAVEGKEGVSGGI